MNFRLKLREPVAKGVRRIGLGQIDQAMAALAREDRDAGIHEARKCFKRVRALLDMSRPALSEKIYRCENRRFRDLGRVLAGPRDVHVMRQTLERLQQQRDLSEAGGVPSALRAWLETWRAQVKPDAGGGRSSEAQAALADARDAFAGLHLRSDGIAPLVEGFQNIYADGRKTMRLAYRNGVEDEIFHEWRKHVQRHWRHLQLFRNAWPEEFAPRIDLASELSELIGVDHDLAVLIAFIRRNRAILGARGQVAALIRAAEAEQSMLRKTARPRGERLYALPPKAMAQMLETNWKVSRTLAKETRAERPTSNRQNVVTLAQP